MNQLDTEHGADSHPVKVSFFAHNRKDAAVVRRALSFMDSGIDLRGFMFRRDGEQRAGSVPWRNIDLGYVEHCQHLKRLLTLAKAVWRIFQHRQEIAESEVIYARNLDMLGLAFVAKLFVPFSRHKVIYEVLDVHDAMTRSNATARVLRWVERWALRQSDLLVVSSPGFMREYFLPVQGYQGEYELVENKLYFHEQYVNRPSVSPGLAAGDPLVLAWVGILRCQETLSLLIELARAFPDKVVIRMSGKISEFLIPDFLEQIEPCKNIEFLGEYTWPEGLAGAYDGAHLVWSQELSWKGYNSDWLLPNRIYEASYFGVLSVAVRGTETARTIEERDLGYAIEEATPESLIKFISGLDHRELQERQDNLLKRPASEFVASPDDILGVINNVMGLKDRNRASSRAIEAKG